MSNSLHLAIAFLRSIGLPVVAGEAPSGCFFPGVWYENGGMGVDLAIARVGDLLHDAGHMAILPSVLRQLLKAGSVSKPIRAHRSRLLEEMTYAVGVEHPYRFLCRSHAWEESTASAWSYAAAVAAGIDPVEIFASVSWYKEGKPTGGMELLEAIASGTHQGIVGLVDAAMVPPGAFPALSRWLAEPLTPADLERPQLPDPFARRAIFKSYCHEEGNPDCPCNECSYCRFEGLDVLADPDQVLEAIEGYGQDLLWECSCGWSGTAAGMRDNPSGSRVCPTCGASGGMEARHDGVLRGHGREDLFGPRLAISTPREDSPGAFTLERINADVERAFYLPEDVLKKVAIVGEPGVNLSTLRATLEHVGWHVDVLEPRSELDPLNRQIADQAIFNPRTPRNRAERRRARFGR